MTWAVPYRKKGYKIGETETPPGAMFLVSQSKVSAWRMCQLKYHKQYVEHLRRKVISRPLKIGRIIHKLHETSAEGKSWDKALTDTATHERKLFEAERELYGDIISDTRYIMRAYHNFWKEDLLFVTVDGHKAEIPFEVELTSDITCKGRMDGNVQSKGFKWLLENKNHKTFPNDDHRWRNLQSVVYLSISEKLGRPLEGLLWNYIRTKSPTRPQLLKSGQLSEKSIDSLPEVVFDTITQHKLRVADYKALIDAQTQNLQTWFQRIYTPIKKHVVKIAFLEFIRTARDMHDYYDKTQRPPPRNIGRHCEWCQYEALCRAELQGLDVDFVKEREYIYDDSEYQTEGEIE